MSGEIAGLALVIALLGVGGCGGAHADSPAEAAERWLDAVQGGRYE